jgi:hypothetical protein
MGASSAGPSHFSEEDRVRSKILGTPAAKYKSYRGKEKRAPEENIGLQLLSQFDSEADDEEDGSYS